MRKAVITVSLYDKTFTTEFEIDNNVKEYEVADEAYRLAMTFLNTQTLAIFGHDISGSRYEELLENLNYEYDIAETEDV